MEKVRAEKAKAESDSERREQEERAREERGGREASQVSGRGETAEGLELRGTVTDPGRIRCLLHFAGSPAS